MRATPDSTCLKNSPVPTNSCQRDSTSPRSKVPSVMPMWTASAASAYAVSAADSSAFVACSCAAVASTRASVRGSSESKAPVSVWRTTIARAFASRASAESHACSRPIRSGPSSPSGPSVVSGTVNTGARPRPCSLSIETRCGRTSSTASGGTRSSTTATDVPRSEAWRSSAHGTASAYRAAVVTKSHRSAAKSSWSASSRLLWTTESMSGASSRATPGGSASEGTRRTEEGSCAGARAESAPVTRPSPARTRSPVNHASSAGWCTSTGERVVGRSTPGRLTTAPTRELTRVDLPAPVEPPTTASSGASIEASRGRM